MVFAIVELELFLFFFDLKILFYFFGSEQKCVKDRIVNKLRGTVLIREKRAMR